jgi:lysine 6-dehydrogenase
MKIMLLGVGQQGRAALYDLAHSPQVTEIVAADREVETLRAHVAVQGYSNVRCARVDAADPLSLHALLAERPDVAIDLLPVPFIGAVAAAAVEHGVHLVNTFYTVPELAALAGAAQDRGVTLLPEFGLDPGIDLVILGHAVRSLDRVTGIVTYGAGVPEPEAADNLLRYKISWTFEGVLRSYLRAARLVREGRPVDIPPADVYLPQHTHYLEVEGLGRLEAIPNGDALRYAPLLGLDLAALHTLGRYSLRWPGHCAFWRVVTALGLLDGEPVVIDGHSVDRKRYLAAALAPRLQYAPHERDVVIVRVEVSGEKAGRPAHAVYTIIDRRDLQTGHMAMNRTVGYTASIGAQMIARGQIVKRGLLSPVNDVPYDLLERELGRRGIHITVE